MPNWVTTVIHIEGGQKELDRFKKFSINDNFYAREEKLEDRRILFDFGRFLPKPKDADWYTWQCDNWGTKWNANYVEWDDSQEGCLRLQFETAWDRISDKLWNAIKKKFPKLKFELEADEEAGFFHSVTVDGKIIDIKGERNAEEQQD